MENAAPYPVALLGGRSFAARAEGRGLDVAAAAERARGLERPGLDVALDFQLPQMVQSNACHFHQPRGTFELHGFFLSISRRANSSSGGASSGIVRGTKFYCGTLGN